MHAISLGLNIQWETDIDSTNHLDHTYSAPRS